MTAKYSHLPLEERPAARLRDIGEYLDDKITIEELHERQYGSTAHPIIPDMTDYTLIGYTEKSGTPYNDEEEEPHMKAWRDILLEGLRVWLYATLIVIFIIALAYWLILGFS